MEHYIGEMRFRADHEHSALRAAVMFVLVAAFTVLFAALWYALENSSSDVFSSYAVALACISSLAASVAMAYLVESLLKKIWPSGRAVSIGSDWVRAITPSGEIIIDRDAEIARTLWQFKLAGTRLGGRERRAPKSHICLAQELRQGENSILVHAFMHPNKAKKHLKLAEIQQLDIAGLAPGRGQITRLDQTFANRMPATLISGELGRFWRAERRRWSQGLELTPDDFIEFNEQVSMFSRAER